ncbi:helix-turn-helix domain-containing protein [Spiractinospora alimapuensis]|uniref:DUF5753 domain-containing protein n=1 Tax=Spiractinospora alimapuensis TaxID=2820884 RepID=UPI001F39C16F|nr:DUF5753 domain-containing protein [Spiractinospora alimapuensis]QVQ50101.1 helix-turn-helix domain-containing protein [Spiractinospora alimapuensis]
MAASPTLRRRRLARQLLTLRAARGMTVDAVGKEAKRRAPNRPWSAAKITRIENRKLQHLPETDLKVLLDIYRVEDDDERASYIQLARAASQTGWWVGYSDVLGRGAYVDLETEAASLSSFEALVIPGLLQTPGYIRAVVLGQGVTDEHVISRRIEARMMRRQVLERADAPRFASLIDESAIRKIPESVRDEQLKYLIAATERGLEVRVVPDERGPHSAVHGAFVVMRFANDPALVYLEEVRSELFLEEDDEIDHYQRIYDETVEQALTVSESVALLNRYRS